MKVESSTTMQSTVASNPAAKARDKAAADKATAQASAIDVMEKAREAKESDAISQRIQKAQSIDVTA